MKNTTPLTFIRIFHRWSGLFLIVFIALKILSGYVIAGQLGILSNRVGYLIHYAKVVDIPLLFLFIFHSIYGVYKIVQRKVKDKVGFFLIATFLALLLYITAILFIYIF